MVKGNKSSYTDMSGWIMREHGVPDSRLTVICRADDYISPKGEHRKQWLVQCDCGSDPIVVRGEALRNGKTKSCGCMQRESIAAIAKRNRVKDETNARLWRIWNAMHMRCENPSRNGFAYYGGRGIQVCDEWSTFLPFKQWALASGYRNDLTIDRIDSNGWYCPANCRWATMLEQANNTRGNRNITIGNRTQSLSMWLRELHMSPQTFYSRVRRGAIDVAALTTKVEHHQIRYFDVDGVTKTIDEWAQETGLSARSIRDRIRKQWSPHDVVSLPARARPRAVLACE